MKLQSLGEDSGALADGRRRYAQRLAGDRELYVVLDLPSAMAVAVAEGFVGIPLDEESESAIDAVCEYVNIIGSRHFVIPDAILTPLGDVESGDSVLIALFQSSPLMEQIPLVVVASSGKDERRRALRMGMLSTVFPPYDGEEVALTTKLAIEKHRSDQLLFGSLEQLSVADLLQTAEASRRTGTVIFQHDGEKGTVWMRDGFVVDAEVEGDGSGEEAVYRIAVWTTGTFEADFGDLDIEDRFKIPPSTLLLEAMRRFDEESASTIPIPAVEAADTEVLDLSLVLLNVVAGYALNHLNPILVYERFKKVRERLCDEHPQLAVFRVTEEGAVTLKGDNPLQVDEKRLACAVGLLVISVFEELDAALAWRFTSQRLVKLVAPWREKLDLYGFMEGLDVEDRDEASDEDSHGAPGVGGKPVPVGCLVLDREGVVEAYSAFGPRIGRVEPEVVVGRAPGEVLPSQLASLPDQLMRRLIIVRHWASPFPGIFESTAGGACSILSGFHAAILSYLAGRHLAAREVQCAHEPGDPCVFVIATEDRLTKLLIATPGSADHDLLQEIIRTETEGES